MRINLPNGNTISMSAYEFYFLLDDKDVDEFYQSCLADDLGVYINNPFSSSERGRLGVDEDTEEDEEEPKF